MASPRSQRGFTMALALAMAVVMGLMLLKIAPNAIAETQRSNEQELIYRGEAIATSLRIYFAKMRRYPKDLDEVMKMRPRILRQKYKDPMTPSGEWEFITQVQAGASGNTEGLPIVGVRSRSTENSILVYQNKTLHHDWLFSAEQNLLGITDTLNRVGGLPRVGSTPPKSIAPKE